MLDEAKLDGFCQSSTFLLGGDELVSFEVFFDAEGRVSDHVDVTGDAGHHEVVQVVVQWCCSLFQSRVSLHDNLISVALGQLNVLLSIPDIFDELIRSLTQS